MLTLSLLLSTKARSQEDYRIAVADFAASEVSPEIAGSIADLLAMELAKFDGVEVEYAILPWLLCTVQGGANWNSGVFKNELHYLVRETDGSLSGGGGA